MIDWVRNLSDQYERMQDRYPGDPMLIVFDVDGTLLDTRHLVRWLLLDFDRNHGTDYFSGLRAEDVATHENQVGALLKQRGLYHCERIGVLEWYHERRWNPDALLASHCSYQGVWDIVRSFQNESRTQVGINTGRPEAMRQETLQLLNALGREYDAAFENDLLAMNSSGPDKALHAKAAGLRRFRERGYRVFAVVDDDSESLAAMAEVDTGAEILFLHADDIHHSKLASTPDTPASSRLDSTEPATYAEQVIEGSLAR
jgi:FMN phosphatase YigB (HAD superfamily)